jgi:V8-like Glu-specific endopeptidase
MTFYWQGESGQELKTVQGTGFLISGQVVVTAKHNFYHKSQKGRCSGCTIQFSNPSDPFNSITYHSKQSNEWFEDPNLDVGAVFLEQPVRHFRGNIRLATRNDILQLRERERE